MAKSKSLRLVALEHEWRRRFGGPPPITTGATLLARVLRETTTPEKRS